jgi:molybdopterin converting factor small subunit
MIVHVGSVLHEYTGGRAHVEARGATVAAVLDDLERRHPGLRFRVIDEQGRVRPHMRIYVGAEPVTTLARRVRAGDELHVLGALSGG